VDGWMDGWMDVRLAIFYFLFKSFSITGRNPVSMNILAPKTGTFQIRPSPKENNMALFSKNPPRILIKLQ
jgi:hypothetical protein